MAEERGFWNRAGRRSGGNRPMKLLPQVPEITCLGCGLEEAWGLLVTQLLGDTEIKACPRCNGVLFVNHEGRWLTAAEFERATSTPVGDTP